MKTPHLRILASAVILASPAALLADPLPNQFPKFFQAPEIATPILNNNGTVQTYSGHDELSTAKAVTNTTGQITGYTGTFMADDFADKLSTPVYHISWWGSYLNSTVVPTPHVQKFLIAFESDVPATPGGFSTPGTILSQQVVTLGVLAPSSGTFTEAQVSPNSVDGPIYKYNAELALPFAEQANVVYWLKIVALDDGVTITNPTGTPIQWGWHNRDFTQQDLLASAAPQVSPGEASVGLLPDGVTNIYHFQDDAVSGAITYDFLAGIRQSNYTPMNYINGVDGPGLNGNAAWPGIGGFSKDLAFELFTQSVVPEPASLGLLAIGAAALLRKRR